MANANNYDKGAIFQERFKELVGKSTQEEVAKKVNTSRQNVGNWLNGKSRPDIYALAEISKGYNVSTDYLLGLTDIKSADTTVQGICEYIGCNEAVVNAIKHEYTKYLIFGDIDDALYQATHNVYLNNILSSKKVGNLLSDVVSLYWESEHNYKFYNLLMVDDIKRMIKALKISGDCALYHLIPYVKNREIERLSDERMKAEELSHEDGKSDIECDLARYNASKALEALLNEFDWREIRNEFTTKEQWLNYLKISDDELLSFKLNEKTDK